MDEHINAPNDVVEQAFQHLLDTYLATPHRKKVELITRAFNFANQAHKGAKRLSGEPYIMHPLAVAQIACEEMGLGSTSICAALLHDVVEDTDYTIEDLSNVFGEKIAQIVEGLTKISGGIFGEHASAQAENFKKLLLTMSDDIRVILIKICDRLHNMRTLDAQPANKQYKIAGETLYIYAPLANRLGLNKIKTELENLSFRFEHPETYDSIMEKLTMSQEERDNIFTTFTAPIREALDAMGLQYKIKARVKSPYSIWRKMQNKHVTFDEIYDLLAVRIIFTPSEEEQEINECFKIYVAISRLYKAHPDRLRDWLIHPKANGYQALHVTLMSNIGRWIEVQIRSQRMDELAEKGFAAHWIYKEGPNAHAEDDTELNGWLSTIKEILDDPQPDAIDFLDAIKLNLYASEIFVFTPKGEIITMPADATALDFAYQIHSFLGSHCIGAKVNHKLVPLSHTLQSGDQVEILTSKSQHVQESWLGFVTTAKARSKIQLQLRRDNRAKQKEGNDILKVWLQQNGLELTTAILDRLCKIFALANHEALLITIGKGMVTLSDKEAKTLLNKGNNKKGKWRKFVPFLKSNKDSKESETEKFTVDSTFNKKKAIVVNESNYSTYIFSDCCRPIPGDDILGFIDNNNNIVIHKRSCGVADKLKTSFGDRLVDANWDMHHQLLFDATLQLRGIDRKGMIHDVAEVITDEMDIDIRSVSIAGKDGIFDGTIKLCIHDNDELSDIVSKLKKIEGVHEVTII